VSRQAEEVVRLIRQADEPTSQPADAAIQPDRLFALLLNLQVQVYSAFLGVALDFDRFVRFDAVEIIQLVQAKDTDFPCALIESEPSSITIHGESLCRALWCCRKTRCGAHNIALFVEAQRDINYSVRVINVEFRLGRESINPKRPYSLV